jgi:hypothetical protein
MFSQIYYVIRSRADGSYLAAHPNSSSNPADTGYLLMFRENFEALSYLNTHGASVADRFTVESVPGSQLKNLLKRWGFVGMGMVIDPLIPSIEFLLPE